jgi:hypothetical protein
MSYIKIKLSAFYEHIAINRFGTMKWSITNKYQLKKVSENLRKIKAIINFVFYLFYSPLKTCNETLSQTLIFNISKPECYKIISLISMHTVKVLKRKAIKP